MDKIWYKDHNCEVHLFQIDMPTKQALIWSPQQAAQANGSGWLRVPLKRLLPTEFANHVDGSYMSKSERNEIISHITPENTIWTTTDGLRYDDKEEAIAHQRELLNAEK